MRYLLQFVVPILIFVGVVYVLGRRRRAEIAHRAEERSHPGSDVGAFLVILTLGAAVAIVTFLVLQSLVG